MFSMLVKRSTYDSGFSERLLKRPFAAKWYDSRFGMREPWVRSVLEMPRDARNGLRIARPLVHRSIKLSVAFAFFGF